MRCLRPLALALAVLVVLVPVLFAQSVSSGALRDLFRLKGVSYDKAAQRLKATWPLVREAELRAFATSGREVFVGSRGGLRIADHSRIRLREVMFQAPTSLRLSVSLLRPSSILELHLAGPAAEHSPLVVFLNRPIKVGGQKARRSNGALEMRFGIREAPLGLSASGLADGREARIALEVTEAGLALRVGGAPALEIPATMPAMWGLSLNSPRGGVRISSLELDAAVVELSLRKLLRAGRSVRRSEKGDGDSGVVISTWMAQFMLARQERMATYGRLLKQIQKGRLGWGGPRIRQAERDLIARAVEEIGTGQRSGAVTLRRLAAAHEGQSFLSVLLAYYETDRKQAERAEKTLRSAVKHATRAPEAWRVLGILLLERSEEREALECFETSAKQDSGSPWTRAFHGLALMRLGQFEKARSLVRSARGKLPRVRALRVLEEQVSLLGRGPFGRTTKVVKTKHYTIESSLPKKQLAALGSGLDRYRDYLQAAFPLPGAKAVSSRVWLFDSREEYVAYTGTLTSRLENTGGVFHPTLNTLLLFSGLNDSYNLHVLQHEAFHQYLDQLDVTAPHWLNEGLAEYFGATVFGADGTGTPGGLLENRLATLRAHFAAGREPVSLEKLALMTPQQFMAPLGVSLHYAQSWSMVRWFEQGTDALASANFDAYVAAILAGLGRKGAWRDSFGQLPAAALKKIEKDWRADLESRAFKEIGREQKEGDG